MARAASWVVQVEAREEKRAAGYLAEADIPGYRRRICSTWRMAGYPILPRVATLRW